MESRDAKIKIQYSLNYFRAIQKRLMLDLREFGTRERILGDVSDPFIAPEEADQKITETLNMILSDTNKAIREAEHRRQKQEIEERKNQIMKEQERKEKERKKNALNLDDDADYSIINDDQIEELER